jgi:TolB-like protein
VNLRNFFAELKRRNVYKVAIAYGVVAWLLMQVASQIFPFFEIPNWAVRLVVLLLVIGFPVAMILAWAFELTPEGIKRTESADELPKKTSRNRAWLYVVVIGGAISASLFFFGRYTAISKQGGLTELPAKSIAVLPFDNLSCDPDNAYFTEGIQDEILTRLAKVADLKVISRASTQRFKSAPDNLPVIAKQLGVTNILEGSVQKSANQVRVNVQLINALTDAHLWAEIYDRKLTDIFAVESDIAKTIAETLRAKLTGPEKHAISAKPTDDPEAHQLYLKGRFFWNKRSGSDLLKAIDYFSQAIEKDPNYALAYAGIADSYNVLFFFSSAGIAPKEAFPKAKAAALKALAIDNTLGEAHNALAYVLFSYDWDFAGAEREFRRAIELNPNYATAHQWYSEFLSAMGQHAEAITEIKRAQELDPISLIINSVVGVIYERDRQYDEAVRQLRSTLAMDQNFGPAHQVLFSTYEANDNYEEAIVERQAAVLAYGRESPEVASKRTQALRKAYAKGGARGYWQERLDQVTEDAKGSYVPPSDLARTYARLGQKDEALEWLEKAYNERDEELLHVNERAAFDNLRSDPRYTALVEKVFGATKTPGEAR